MKRPISSFTVEVRRRSSRAATHQAPKWFEADPPAAAGGPDARRAAAAAFEPRRPADPLPEARATVPQGRVLPSLVETVPLHDEPGDDVSTLSPPTDAAENDTRVSVAARLKRPRRTTSSPVRRPPIESVVMPAMPEPPPAFQPPKALKISAAEPRPESMFVQRIVVPTPRQPVAEARSQPEASPAIVIPPVAPAPKKRSYTKSKIAERPSPPPLPEAPKPAMKADPPAAKADAGEAERSKRKRKIMSRYVYRDEFKLGELWKKRLRKSR